MFEFMFCHVRAQKPQCEVMVLCFLLVDKRCVILDVSLCAPTQIGSLTTLTAIAIFVWELVRLLIDDFMNFMNLSRI